MTDSLKDQLLKLGFKTPAQEERRPGPKPAHAGAHGRRDDRKRDERGRNEHPARTDHARGDQRRRDGAGGDARPSQPPRATRPPAARRDGDRARGDIDLAKAYAIRSQREKDERIAAEKAKQEEAARRREGKTKLIELLKTASRNDAAAEIARHFEYGGKIRRVYVTAEQLRQVNAGELAVVQQNGRYHVVSPADARAADALLPGALALLVDPNAPAPEVDYADPKFQVPDDLVW